MRTVDLSQTLQQDMQVYPGDPCFHCRPAALIDKDGYNVSMISLGTHTGTHVDAPFHFFARGATIDKLPLDVFMGRAVVVDVSGKDSRAEIHWADIAPYEERLPGSIVLLRTDWSQHFNQTTYAQHPFLTRSAAERLVFCGIKLLGIDAFSPDATYLPDEHVHSSDFGAHEVLLGNGIPIAENLARLKDIQEGIWNVNLVPLRLRDCDGSPVRAFAWQDQ